MRTKSSFKCGDCGQWVLFGGRDAHPCTAPKTDLQSRLRHIASMCKEIETAKKESDPDLSRLAYWVSYLAGIVDKHLSTDEK
jgi:hypothetical protein